MARDKLLRRLEAKIDLLLERQGMKAEDVAKEVDRQLLRMLEEPARAPRELTPQEQDAIDNAPKAEASVPPAERGPRVTKQNAPDTSSSVPKDAGSITFTDGSEFRVPAGAKGNVTVETIETVSADKAKTDTKSKSK